MYSNFPLNFHIKSFLPVKREGNSNNNEIMKEKKRNAVRLRKSISSLFQLLDFVRMVTRTKMLMIIRDTSEVSGSSGKTILSLCPAMMSELVFGHFFQS